MSHYMLGAWVARAESLRQQLQQIDAAPALFQPEYVAQVIAQFRIAQGWIGYWATVGGA